MNNLTALDIETAGLSPIEHRVVSVAVRSDDEFAVWESANERQLLDDLAYWLRSRSGVLCTWNGSSFDFPFLLTRAQLSGSRLTRLLTLAPSATRAPQYGPLDGHDAGYLVSIPGWDHVDVMLPWRDIARRDGHSHALKRVAALMGIDVIEVDRTRICELSAADLAAYNVSDTDATLRLAYLLEEGVLGEWVDSLEFVMLSL